MAVTQHSIRVVKEFAFQGGSAKQFSNRYYFDGDSPGDSSDWHTLMDALVLLEKTIFLANVTITELIGYAPGSEVPVATKTYSVPGTYAAADARGTPGECCAVVRWATGKRSTKNHIVYVFSYFHGATYGIPPGDPDLLYSAQKTLIEAYADEWLTGFTVAGRTYRRTTPDGHVVTGRVCNEWISHRDFPH